MKWEQPVFAQLQNRFSQCEVPPESNANYAFVLTALDEINGQGKFYIAEWRFKYRQPKGKANKTVFS